MLAVATVANATDLQQFLPGPRLIDGSQLNTVVDQVNDLSNGTAPIGSGVNQVSITGGATTVDPVITVGGTSSDTNIGLLLAGKGTGPLHLGGSTKTNASVRVPTVANAVNQITLQGAATGTPPQVSVGGLSSDTNVGLFVAGAGTGPVYIGGTSTTLAGLQVAQTASRVNSIVVTPSATTVVPSISVGGAGADTNVNLSVKAAGTGIVNLGQTIATCSGTTTATCNGQRFVVSVTGLTTTAGSESAAMVVTNSSVASSAVPVHCQVNGYSGTGKPLIYNVTAGTNSVTFTVLNVATSGNLNATVPVACVAF
jgi:hypothetical protein